MIIGIMVKKGSLTNYGEKKDHLYFVSPYLQIMVKKCFMSKNGVWILLMIKINYV